MANGNQSEKIENLLNLSLSATEEEMMKSPILGDGIVERENEPVWEVIVKYHGDISGLRSERIQVEELINGYGIITLPESFIEPLAAMEEIEYVEKPKSIYPSDYEGNIASCVTPVTIGEPFLTGEGVLIGIIDSGIDIYKDCFRNEDGTTRIVYLYDQTLNREFSETDINKALHTDSRQQGFEIVPSVDVTGHGTAVASIAAGKVYGGYSALTQGVATKSMLIVVKLNAKGQNSFPMTTNLMRAFYYVVTKAVSLKMPVSVNLSFGNTYGSHDGSSLVERFLDNVSEIGRTVICVGSGNEGASSGHVSGKLTSNSENQVIEFSVGEYERNFNLQIWKNYVDDFLIELTAPSLDSILIDLKETGTVRRILADTQLLLFVGVPKPYGVNQEIFLDFLPKSTYVTSGIWKVTFIPRRIVVGEYKLYMPSSTIRGSATRFLTPSTERTLTIPSTAGKIITVGAYDPRYRAYADFSGRGYVEQAAGLIGSSKPDVVAPGVGILAEAPGQAEPVTVSGTSFATPFVTGGAALLMEWGIVRGNDPYLYGEKMKAVLRSGASPLFENMNYPNERVGYGALCVEGSLP
ncbi:MAG: S8 family serine peptidase [Lachnospiraceae bacterium]|nr:S8 family serine peptidase [Lachnospiraceae bacterium]